jgi:TfoX/Sxy family transcriptional regulator of competence genes
MAYDEALADNIRDQLAGEQGMTEKAMFGGLAFLLHGNMAISASGRGGLMVRVGQDGEEEALAQPHTEVVVMRGRPMLGWIRVAAEGVRDAAELTPWVRRAVEFTRTLPPKS